MKYFPALLLLLAGLCGQPAAALPAQTPAYRYFDVLLDPDKWGGSATGSLGFRLFDGVDSELMLRYGALWAFDRYYRLPDLSLYRADLYPGQPTAALDYQKISMPWTIGLVQGMHFDPAKDRNDLSLILAWRGLWNWNMNQLNPASLLVQSQEAGRDWNLTNVLVAALHYGGITEDIPSNTKSGLMLDASLELAPLGWSTPAGTNYLQTNLAISGFLPLYRLVSPAGYNQFSLMLCIYSAMDVIAGLGSDAQAGIPFQVSREFGGLKHRPGLGGSVRGLGDGWGDGATKWTGNIELRANLPAFLDPKLLFGVFGFLDTGAWANPPGLSANSALRSGFTATAGLGINLSFFGLGDFVARTIFMIGSPNSLGQYWVPIELDFGMLF